MRGRIFTALYHIPLYPIPVSLLTLQPDYRIRKHRLQRDTLPCSLRFAGCFHDFKDVKSMLGSERFYMYNKNAAPFDGLWAKPA